MPRRSLHVEPTSPLQFARHDVRELIYGANDGIITTSAVVAGVAGVGALAAGRPDYRGGPTSSPTPRPSSMTTAGFLNCLLTECAH
jgi:hypothetical protein